MHDKDQMTPRERWLAVLNRQPFDRVPLDYRATPEATDRLLAHLGYDHLHQIWERFHIDPVAAVGPAYVGPPIPAGKDMWGVGYQRVDYGGGVYDEVVSFPLARYETVAEIEASYTWPTLEWFDFTSLPGQLEGKDDWVVQAGHVEEFANYKNLRGVEQAYMDLIEKPDMVHYCLQKLFAFQYEMLARIYEQIPGRVMWTWVAEDFGTQESLLMSLGHIREYFVPHFRRLNDLVHEHGAYSFHHSDGAVRDNLPQMIETGMDVLDPVQWRCRGMEREGLKRDFGDQLIFHGAMDNQYTLAFGTPAECRQEAVDNIEILGAGGGLILGPCHNIQSVSPPENIVAYYEAAYEAGWCD